MYSIYSLKESGSDVVKYIGLTKQDIKNRLAQHIYKSRSAKRKNRAQAWIISCLNSGNEIKISIIEKNIDNLDLAITRESYFIKYYRKLNHSILNETDGGSCAYDGSYWKGRKQSAEHTNKIANALKGRKPTEKEIKKSVEGMLYKVYNGTDKNAIKVDQYDLSMNYIKTWPSIRRIVAETGFGYRGIWNNINNKGKKSYGYIWKKSRS